ncbi:hypothetical protein GJ744_006975 [Endocarpon pusillum]|uniref:Uncharacterized protein n=1 Tax=Endocarpon pusillum TaxID=364733 RepID=A0A8H7E4K4_9EURO|nr:hypothetical protein GJ744_006975 [Endocarpon pusillum]
MALSLHIRVVPWYHISRIKVAELNHTEAPCSTVDLKKTRTTPKRSTKMSERINYLAANCITDYFSREYKQMYGLQY